MDVYSQIDLQDCPVCHGDPSLEEESGCGYYVVCLDCGCHTGEMGFRSEEDRLEAAKKAAHLWNIGKVISHNPGE